MRYTTSLDWIARVVTVLITALITAIGIASFGGFSLPGQHTGPGPSAIIAFLLMVTFVFCMLQWTRGYTVTSSTLVINKLVGQRVIARENILSVFPVKDNDLRWSIRTFGSGGLFGYFGKFYNTKYGDMTWYATRVSRFVMVELKGGEHIVLTPDQEDLVEKLKG